MSAWPTGDIVRIAATDDLHIAPHHRGLATTGTPTWIWSVVVDGRVFVRAWNGTKSRWYKAAIMQRSGYIIAAGTTYEVEFSRVTEPTLNTRIDHAYHHKYAGSPYLPPMVAEGPKAATIEVRPSGQDEQERTANPPRQQRSTGIAPPSLPSRQTSPDGPDLGLELPAMGA